MTSKHPWLRPALAVLSVPLLAAPSAYGVYTYLEPQSGTGAAVSAAIGFELLYIGVNVLALRTEELRRYARNVALCAVATAVVFNTLAHYRMTVPDIAHTAVDIAALALAIIGSLPLAGLAYATSVLLHRLTEQPGVNSHVDSLSSELAETRARLTQALDAQVTEVSTPVKQLTAGVDDRRARVKALVDGGATKVDAARAVGVSRQTVDKWLKGE